MSGHATVDMGPSLPHSGDCIATLCTACGCCMHCADDGHCDGRPGCPEQDCGCGWFGVQP